MEQLIEFGHMVQQHLFKYTNTVMYAAAKLNILKHEFDL